MGADSAVRAKKRIRQERVLARYYGAARTGLRPAVLLVLAVVLTPAAQAASFLYVANTGSNDISAYSVGSGGMLVPVAGSPFQAGQAPLSVVTNAKGTCAFVANSVSNDVWSYAVNQSTGALSVVSQLPTGGSAPNSAAATPKGTFLYVTNTNSNDVSGFAIAADCSLSAVSGSFETGTSPMGVSLTPNGKFFYVANQASDSVSAFSVNSSTGELSPVSGSPFSTGSGTGPGWVIPDTKGKFLYVVNVTANSLYHYQIAANGGITFKSPPNRAECISRPIWSGTFLAISSTLGNNIFVLSQNANNGTLSQVSGSPFQNLAGTSGPAAEVVSSTSTAAYMVIVNGLSNNVSVFSFNKTTGGLTGVGTFATGTQPNSAAVAP